MRKYELALRCFGFIIFLSTRVGPMRKEGIEDSKVDAEWVSCLNVYDLYVYEFVVGE